MATARSLHCCAAAQGSSFILRMRNSICAIVRLACFIFGMVLVPCGGPATNKWQKMSGDIILGASRDPTPGRRLPMSHSQLLVNVVSATYENQHSITHAPIQLCPDIMLNKPSLVPSSIDKISRQE